MKTSLLVLQPTDAAATVEVNSEWLKPCPDRCARCRNA